MLYVSFGSKVRPRTFGCVSIGNAVFFILGSRLILYSAGSGVNRVHFLDDVCKSTKNYIQDSRRERH